MVDYSPLFDALRARNRLSVGIIGDTGSGSGNSGAQSGGATGANYGPGGSLAPGKQGSTSPVGIGLTIASQAIPGARAVGFAGQAFNSGARSAQLADAIGQLSGQTPSDHWGAFLGGVFGMGTKDSDFGKAAKDHGLNPDEADNALSNNLAMGNINAMGPPVGPDPSFPGYTGAQLGSMPGYGIAGIAGPAATGVNTDVGVNPQSAAGFGQPGITSMAQGNDGVNAATIGDPGAVGFGGMASGNQASAASNSEGSQGSAGASGQGGGSGGSQGGGGANGGGGDNAGGWADGGTVDAHHDFRAASGMAREQPEGIVRGKGGPKDDAVRAFVAEDGFVVPAAMVGMFGDGDPAKGARIITAALPPAKVAEKPSKVISARLSAGEYYIHPAHVAAIGGGDAKRGTKLLTALVDQFGGG